MKKATVVTLFIAIALLVVSIVAVFAENNETGSSNSACLCESKDKVIVYLPRREIRGVFWSCRDEDCSEFQKGTPLKIRIEIQGKGLKTFYAIVTPGDNEVYIPKLNVFIETLRIRSTGSRVTSPITKGEEEIADVFCGVNFPLKK